MRWLRNLLLLSLLVLPTQSWAAVAFGSQVNVTPGTGTNTGASPSITTPTTKPVVVVLVATSSATDTVSSLTITGFGGTAAQVVSARENLTGTALMSIWCIKAPTANTSGTVQANLSASIPFQMSVQTYSGADQSNPCPTGDAQTDITTSTPVTLTPTNLTANDASVGGGANDLAGNLDIVTTNGRYRNNTTAINESAGDSTGTTGVTIGCTTCTFFAKAAIRIAASSGVATPRGQLLGVYP